MKASLDFVKLHAGWDENIFILGEQLPKDIESREVACLLLNKPNIQGTEVGILYPSSEEGDLRIEMVNSTTCDYIRMCGGITQSLPKALLYQSFNEKLGIDFTEGENKISLDTDLGIVPINFLLKNGEIDSVVTDMKVYLEECYRRGVELVDINGLELASVGINDKEKDFLVIDVEELSEVYPDVNFFKKDVEALRIIKNIYKEFLNIRDEQLGVLYGVLYNFSKSSKLAKVIFRFYPWDYTKNEKIEFACGTGSVALGIALNEKDSINLSNGQHQITLRVGGDHLPEEKRTTTYLTLEGSDEKVNKACFSHQPIEIIAEGKVYIAT